MAKGRKTKRKVAPKALEKFKARVREVTDRTGGRSMKSVFAGLQGYLAGWKAYFRPAGFRTARPVVWQGGAG